jgi:hypothetical protein
MIDVDEIVVHGMIGESGKSKFLRVQLSGQKIKTEQYYLHERFQF